MGLAKTGTAQSDQSLHCPHEESFGPDLPTERTAKTLISISMLVLSRGSSFVIEDIKFLLTVNHFIFACSLFHHLMIEKLFTEY